MVDLSFVTDNIYDIQDLAVRENLELFLQELEVIFNTSSSDIYAHPKTLNLRKYVFSKSVSNYQVSSEVRTYVIENCYHSHIFPFEVSTSFIKGLRENDIMYIKFLIHTSPTDTFNRQFMVTL